MSYPPPGSPQRGPGKRAIGVKHKPSTQRCLYEYTRLDHSMRAAAGPLLLLLSSAAATESGSTCTAIGENVRETGGFVACCDTLVLLDVSPPNAEVPVYVCAGQPSGDPTPSGTPTPPTTSPSPKPSPSPTPPTGGRCAVYHSAASPPPTCLICDKAQKRKVCASMLEASPAGQRGRAQAADWLRTVGA